jgi:hypothetical protein
MIIRPAILALLAAASANCAIALATAPFALRLLRRWDLASGAELQLRLERGAFLVSTLVRLLLLIQLFSLLLFVLNADHIAPLFIGAMCAVGVLQSNPYGFPALYAQIAVFFLAAVWLALDHADNLAPDYPLTRLRFKLWLALAPVLALQLALQLAFFLGLRPDVITSCCSRLFAAGAGAAATLATIAPAPAMAVFTASLALSLAAATYSALRGRGGVALAAAGALAFAATLAAIVSFLSLYVYEHPNHHCPFCLLKSDFAFQGYWLYIPLFTATATALAAGAIDISARSPSLATLRPRLVARLGWASLAGFALAAVAAAVMIFRSNLILLSAIPTHFWRFS